MNLLGETIGICAIATADAITSDPTIATATSWLQLVERFGVMAVILFYFLARDYLKNKQEEKQKAHDAAYRERLETYVRDTLVKELQLNRTAITKSSMLMKQVVQSSANCPAFNRVATDNDSDLYPTPEPTDVQHESGSDRGSPL